MNERYPHVPQPAGSELCFAAVSSSALRGLVAVEEANQALQAGFVSEDDGSTAPMWDAVTVPMDGGTLAIEPVQSPMEGASTPEEFIKLIETTMAEQHKPIAVLLNKNLWSTNPDEAQMHWVLLTDQEEGEGGVFEIEVMNPESENLEDVHISLWETIVRHSWHTSGIFAYTLAEEPAQGA